jgi:hypothetical protein
MADTGPDLGEGEKASEGEDHGVDTGEESWKSEIGGNGNKNKKKRSRKKPSSGPEPPVAPPPAPEPESPIGAPPEAEKAEKDMKGLVYQGGDAGLGTQPVNVQYSGVDQKPDASVDSVVQEPEKVEGPPDDIYGKPVEEKETGREAPEGSFIEVTETGTRSKAALIVVVAVVLIAIAGYILLSPHGGGKVAKTTTTAPQARGTSSATTIGVQAQSTHNTTFIDNIDVFYIYSGPASVNGTRCDRTTNSTWISYSRQFNASEQFYLPMTTGSGACALTVTNISISTPGFSLVSAVPAIPFSIQPRSSLYTLLGIETPSANFTGPMTLMIKER